MRSRDLVAAFRDLFVNFKDILVIFDSTNEININNYLLLPINSTSCAWRWRILDHLFSCLHLFALSLTLRLFEL